MKFIETLREKISGKKFYVLMALGMAASVLQFLAGINLGIPDLPPAGDIGSLVQQLYIFGVGVAGRAAVGKV
jgi:hypothetical protein